MSFSRREFIGMAGAAAVTSPMMKAQKPVRKRPNIVVVMADDHGAWASGPYGCRGVHTPNMDALAEGGTRFDRALVCTPVCSPSRMTYLTGLLPSTHGVQDYLLPADSFGPTSRLWLEKNLTYTEVLASHGYTLGMCGKWHMGEDDKAQVGFTDWSTVPSGGGVYLDPVFVRNGVRTPVKGFREDAIGDYALEFLEKQRGSEKPFYLAVNFYAPHTPYNFQPEKYRAPYIDAEFECFPDLPMNAEENPELKSVVGKRESKAAYSALVTSVDANLGRVMKKLEEMGVREETLVIYTADHGWNAGQHGLWGKGNGSIPLNVYEESLRVPLIWNHAGRIGAGRVVTEMVSNYDFFDSVLRYVGIDAPQDARRVGRSYLPLLEGKTVAWRDRLYFEYAYMRAVRTATLKYVERANGWPSEMFDLAADLGETRNVIGEAKYAADRDALKRELAEYFHRAGAPAIEDWRTTTRQHLPWESDLVESDKKRLAQHG